MACNSGKRAQHVRRTKLRLLLLSWAVIVAHTAVFATIIQGGPKKVSHYQKLPLNRIKTRR